MTRFTSIATWAKALGSAAKTRAGQRKAILQSIAAVKPVIDTTRRNDYYPSRQTTRAKYYRAQTITRQQAYAAKRCEGMTPPARPVDVYGTQFWSNTENGVVNPIQIAIVELIPNKSLSYAIVGEYVVRLTESVTWDNTAYSKAYHAAHGGKKEVSGRTVLIRRVAADGTLDKRDVPVDAWRGNFLLNALITAGIVQKTKVVAALKPVQLHEAFEVKPLRAGRLNLYARTLAGEHYDYCAVWHGITYHAPSVKEAIAGLRTKLRSVVSAKNAPITWDLCKKLGFCDEGVRQFCADFDLDPKGRYTAAQVETLVRGNMSRAAKYESELSTLANAVSYSVTL